LDNSVIDDPLVEKLVRELGIPKKIARKAIGQSQTESEAIEIARTLQKQEDIVNRLLSEFPLLKGRDRRLVEFIVQKHDGNYQHSLWALKRTLLAKRFEQKYSKTNTKKSTKT
jgi:hypothetical protein